MDTKLTLSELMAVQHQFDSEHASQGRPWSEKIGEKNVQILLELTVALSGELGEFANIVKSIARGDYGLEDAKGRLSNELADVFIYVVKLADQLGIDLERAFLEKVELNKERFRKYESKREEQ
jgi:NTP pyrophosphatase (non-canonical NTP hydrolase)